MSRQTYIFSFDYEIMLPDRGVPVLPIMQNSHGLISERVYRGNYNYLHVYYSNIVTHYALLSHPLLYHSWNDLTGIRQLCGFIISSRSYTHIEVMVREIFVRPGEK